MKIEITDYPSDRKISRIIIEFESLAQSEMPNNVTEPSGSLSVQEDYCPRDFMIDVGSKSKDSNNPKDSKTVANTQESGNVANTQESGIPEIPDAEPNTEIPSEMTDLEF